MDGRILARIEKQTWFTRFPRGWPFLLFVLASLGTVVGVLAIERADRQRRDIELDRNLTEIASGIQRRTAENVAVLRAGAALFETQADVSKDRFTEFATGLQTDRNLHGSLGMGWAALVRREQIAVFEMDTREKEGSDFLIYPRPGPDSFVTVPIVYLVPGTPRNRRAIGFDMYSEKMRRAAIDKSIALGKPVASGKVHLVQDKDDPSVAAFLIYMPVYASPESNVVKGFVYSPFRASDFLESAAELYRNRDVDIALYDGDEFDENLLVSRKVPGVRGITLSRKILVAEREWTIEVSDKRPTALTPLSRLTIFFGAIASLLVMAISSLFARRAAEDQEIVEWLTRQSAIRDSLTRELNHRVKNTLANVLSIAALTKRRSDNMEEFSESLTARIRALSATHDLLSQTNWRDAPLEGIIRSELAPYLEGDNVHAHLSGPDISLAPNDAMSLGLAIHELATNAAKYGALSQAEGRILIDWKRATPGIAEIYWREEGGPEVQEPSRRGFGRDLIEKVVAHELGSEVDLKFEPTGVTCTLRVPIRQSTDFRLRSERPTD